MDCIILAGGLGTRLRSVVSEVPKCMAPVAGKPFLYFLLKYLSKYPNFDRVILSVGYLREVIFDWIEENKQNFSFEFDFAVEESPLGTGGGIKLALERAKSNNVLILNGDTFFDVDLLKFIDCHNNEKPKISLALKTMSNFDRYGSISLNGKNIIQSFNEKKYCDEALINGGIYLIDKSKCDFSIFPEKFSFETDFLQKEVQKETIFGFIDTGYFIDIGIPEDYERANREFGSL
jgi:D-glycero-alpha-D-manno-heptose 1-phosphate guanylyltransferase